MTPHVLILSSIYDFAVDIVARKLQERRVPYLRLNREQLPHLRMTLRPSNTQLSVAGLGVDACVDTTLRSVWFRCATFPKTISTKVGFEDALASAQWNAFIRGLTVFDEARWMNHPVCTYAAESKLFQLRAAGAVGFDVPMSLATNDAAEVQRTFDGLIAMKSVDTAYVKDGDEAIFAYTQLLPASDLSDENVSAMPIMAQQALHPKADFRVTVVADKLFAYKILVDGLPARGDWRLNSRAAITYEHTVLDEHTATRCIALCARLKLPYGAIDLAVSGGRMWFIEVNPTGEWAWLPDAADTAGVAITDWLMADR